MPTLWTRDCQIHLHGVFQGSLPKTYPLERREDLLQRAQAGVRVMPARVATKELCFVQSFRREELFYLCVEAIRREDSEIPIIAMHDRGPGNKDFEDTCGRFNCINSFRQPHTFYGNSYALLDSLSSILTSWSPYILPVTPSQFGWYTPWRDPLPIPRTSPSGFSCIVHCVEEDTIIHPGYLSWAREKLSEVTGFPGQPIDKYAAVCGRIGSPHIPNWYESPCASWNADCLRIALSHIVPEYFSPDRLVMQKVLDEKIFPNSKYKKGGAEQDGFFLRCIEHHGWKTCFPPKPLATHLGFWGMNCPPSWERPKGSFEERIQFCRDLLKDKERRNNIFGHGITAKEWEGWHP